MKRAIPLSGRGSGSVAEARGALSRDGQLSINEFEASEGLSCLEQVPYQKCQGRKVKSDSQSRRPFLVETPWPLPCISPGAAPRRDLAGPQQRHGHTGSKTASGRRAVTSASPLETPSVNMNDGEVTKPS